MMFKRWEDQFAGIAGISVMRVENPNKVICK